MFWQDVSIVVIHHFQDDFCCCFISFVLSLLILQHQFQDTENSTWVVSTLMYGPGRLREMQSSINCIKYFLGIDEWNMAHWCSTHITKLRKSGGKLLCTSQSPALGKDMGCALNWRKAEVTLGTGAIVQIQSFSCEKVSSKIFQTMSWVLLMLRSAGWGTTERPCTCTFRYSILELVSASFLRFDLNYIVMLVYVSVFHFDFFQIPFSVWSSCHLSSS